MHKMTEKPDRLLEVSVVAQKLQLDESSVRKMFHNGILQGIKPALH